MVKYLLLITSIVLTFISFTQDVNENAETELSESEIQAIIDSNEIYYQEIEESFNYQTGIIELPTGNAKLNIPKGFHFLDQEQSISLLTEYWGNPEDQSVLGLIKPIDVALFDENSWVFIISFDEMGYVEDDDAADIDYDELEQDLIQETNEGNQFRISQGYGSMEFLGWAEAPYYDQNKKVLHWAKEMHFEDQEENTLNYNLRILGRKGVFMFNAVAGISELEVVNNNVDAVLGSIEFNEGYSYFDFDPDMDDVAAWSIGGLVAGKVLAKVGFFALIVKFWKLIVLGIAGIGSFIWKRKKSNKDSTPRAIE